MRNKEFFPKNRVEYFVSYYDYYQPESYIPSTDTYIEKDMSLNDEIIARKSVHLANPVNFVAEKLNPNGNLRIACREKPQVLSANVKT